MGIVTKSFDSDIECCLALSLGRAGSVIISTVRAVVVLLKLAMIIWSLLSSIFLSQLSLKYLMKRLLSHHTVREIIVTI